MIRFLERAFAAIRVRLGMNDPSENHLHASHGWLLPATSEMRDSRAAAAPLAAPASPGHPRTGR